MWPKIDPVHCVGTVGGPCVSRALAMPDRPVAHQHVRGLALDDVQQNSREFTRSFMALSVGQLGELLSNVRLKPPPPKKPGMEEGQEPKWQAETVIVLTEHYVTHKQSHPAPTPAHEVP